MSLRAGTHALGYHLQVKNARALFVRADVRLCVLVNPALIVPIYLICFHFAHGFYVSICMFCSTCSPLSSMAERLQTQ